MFLFNPDHLEFLRCPRTGSTLLQINEYTLRSAQGGHQYEIIHGIPDFRLFNPPYIDRKEERSVVDALVEMGDHRDYPSLVRHLETELSGLPRGRAEEGIQHRLALRQRAPARLWELVEKVGGVTLPPGSVALDLGCGSGEASAALFQLGAVELISLDISLIELVLAKKLLAEKNIKNVLLIAGCAESLPLASESIDFVFSPDVIEHVTDQLEYLTEAYRVLKKGGQILLNSPNRYSVVCPEPHVGIWGLTLLPRPLIDPVCRLLGKGGYTGKRLVSLSELRKLIRKVFSIFRIESRKSNPHATSLSGKLFRWTSPASEILYSYVCDQHVIIAKK